MSAVRLLFFIFLLGPRDLFASVGNGGSCINGSVEDNKSLITSMETSKDPLHQEFLNALKRPSKGTIKTAVKSVPEPCLATDTNKKNINYLAHLSNHIRTDHSETTEGAPTAKAPLIKRECIAASMTRAPGNNGFTCRYPTAKEAKRGFSPQSQSVLTPYGIAGGNTLQCVNDTLVDYVTFAVNSAIQCMSPEDPIDTRVIFKKLNNETAFNPTLASVGGVGIGQTTTPAKKELTDVSLGKGRYLLEMIAGSSKPECKGFKNVAEADLKQPPRVRNSCDWVSPGNGLARSLMYSIGYYLTLRDQYVIPALEKRSAALLKNKSLVSDFTAIAYGAEGLDQAKWLMQKYRAGKNTNAKTLQNQIRKESIYLSNIKGKMEELTCIRNGKDPAKGDCKEDKNSAADIEADTCVTH